MHQTLIKLLPIHLLYRLCCLFTKKKQAKKGNCIAIGGGTYVHDIEGGVAFGAEMPDYQYNMHGHDEHYPIDHLMAATRMIAAAIIKICGEEK